MKTFDTGKEEGREEYHKNGELMDVGGLLD